MKKISFTLNGEEKEFVLDSADEKLLNLLRRYGYKGTKWGCGEGACGTCTVILNGKTVYSCITYAFLAEGSEIWTIEGMGTRKNPHPIQKALVKEGAVQCGYCIPGMVLSAKAMFDKIPSPNDLEIREYMDGNLCRCTGYEKIYTALKKVAESNAEGGK
ncbi:MAG: (2Fe-2S)-binding protein [Victivallales bacterium]|nr:(2Fe-2S)-binding protein [Victivallales bacterium]MCF7889560.1 (2Fe-2S)-binding protein [Victivallales bacterium]